MPHTLSDVIDAAQLLWPAAGTESWDAPGLTAGDPSTEITRILLAVDAVDTTVTEAIDHGAELLLVHHPLLLRGVTTVAEDRYKGALLARLIRAGCALLSAHTNADVVESGTSAALAKALGLQDARPIVPAENQDGGAATGLGRVGTLAGPVTLGLLARRLAELLPATATGIRVSGAYDSEISTVALCAGAGDSLLSHPEVTSADVYVTSDLRHHPASEAVENAAVAGGPALIDVSHWASEWLWLATAAAELRAALPGVEISVSDARTDPWDFVVTQ